MGRPTAVRHSVLLLLCSVLTGCTALTGGHPQPADGDGPRPVRAAALPAVLLDTAGINAVMGATAMTVRETRVRLFDAGAQFADRACLVAWTAAEQTVYAHSGWTAVAAQSVSEPTGQPGHFVIQSVVAFPSRRDADDFFGRTARRWAPCADRTFVSRRGGGDAAGSWRFGPVSAVDSMLWMTQHQERSRGWSCQRALRVSNNVAIDVLACKHYSSDEAATIVHGIDARLPSL